MCTVLCTADSCRYEYAIRMNPDVELTVFKIVFYEILIMLGIKFITKPEFMQGSETNLELNT